MDNTAAAPAPKPFMRDPNFCDELDRNGVRAEIEGGVWPNDFSERAVWEVETQNRRLTWQH
jgi:hypothetical protein